MSDIRIITLETNCAELKIGSSKFKLSVPNTYRRCFCARCVPNKQKKTVHVKKFISFSDFAFDAKTKGCRAPSISEKPFQLK
jgi:hypothetical protein